MIYMAKSKRLLNYSTVVPISRTVSEIEELLAKSGAVQILKDYDGTGEVSAINFRVKTDRGIMPFKLPLNLPAVMSLINEQITKGLLPSRFKDDQTVAKRIGWRILKQWLEAQLALIELKQVKIQQALLAFIISDDGKTLYEHLESNQFKGYLLDDKRYNQ
jgi:hypothetical protein